MKPIALTLLFALFFSPSFSQNPDKIIDKYWKAIGGKEAWAKVNSIQVKQHLVSSKTSTTGAELKVSSAEILSIIRGKALKKETYMHIDILNGGIPTITSFYEDKGWRVDNPISGKVEINNAIKDLPAEKVAFFKPQTDLNMGLLDYQEKGLIVKLKKTVFVETEDCYEIEMFKADSLVGTYYFSTNSFLLKKTNGVFVQFGVTYLHPGAAEAIYEDYKDINGLQIPYYSKGYVFRSF